MTKIKIFRSALCFISTLFAFTALAQSQGGMHHQPDGSVGFGTAQFNVLSPSDIKLGSGPFVSFTAEKPFGGLPLYLEGQLIYMHSTGNANYNYVSPTNLNYIAPNVNVAADVYDAMLGLRLKFFENYSVRPYLEVGGVGGFFQLSYDNTLRSAVAATGSDYKTIDGLLNFGVFGEAGFDISLANWVSLKVAYKYTDTTTQPVETLKKQSIHYSNNIYYGGLAFRF